MNEMYEELTVPELRALAEESGIDIPHDARKADIIEALEKGAKGKDKESPKGKKADRQMTSTVTASCSPEDFWKLKLIS
jgi:Rho termination factor, N-terminal domain.